MAFGGWEECDSQVVRYTRNAITLGKSCRVHNLEIFQKVSKQKLP